ncbi:MAG: indolepyruvate oxidoreductase subunit beta family protein [Anaerolineae bacterium]
MNEERAICILIGALGGQGGGVLTNWLVEAARLAGYPAQSTSIPGVAQRTGATTYYFELFPVKNPPADPVFCLFPSAGDVDLVAALEPTEAGLALDRGYVSAQTTVISSTARVYSTAEKSVAGNGALNPGAILGALSQTAACLLQVSPEVAPGRQLNAAVFGAIIGSGVLPFSAADGRVAIESMGLAVRANLAGYETGLQIAQQGDAPLPSPPDVTYTAAPPVLAQEVAGMPEVIRPLIGHCLARLVDYQDAAYAHRFLKRLQPILAVDTAANGYRLAQEVARRLAAWMSYEDVMRVAQLKTRPGRLARIRAEVAARAHEPVVLKDYLSPSRTEFMGLLPAALSRLVPGGRGRNGKEEWGFHTKWPTSSAWGYGMLKVMASLRRIRPYTEMYAREQEGMEQWLTAVADAIPHDYELACRVAEPAVWARGYGNVRARGLACLDSLFVDWPHKLAVDVEHVRTEVEQSLYAARHDPDAACLVSI